MLTLLGFTLFSVGCTGVAAKLGYVEQSVDYKIFGHKVHLGFSKDEPISFKIS